MQVLLRRIPSGELRFPKRLLRTYTTQWSLLSHEQQEAEEQELHKRIDSLMKKGTGKGKTREPVFFKAPANLHRPGINAGTPNHITADEIFRVLQKYQRHRARTARGAMENALENLRVQVTPELVVKVLEKSVCLYGGISYRFYVWASRQPDFKPTVDSEPVLLRVICRIRESLWVFALLQEMRRTEPKFGTYRAFKVLAERYNHGHLLTMAVNALYNLEKVGCPPDVGLFSCLLGMYCEENKSNKAMALFWDMQVKFEPSYRNYAILISCLARNGRLEHARHLHRKLLDSGACLTMDVYHEILTGYSKEGKATESVKMLNEMRDMGYGVNAKAITIGVHALCSEGRIDEAFGMIEDMKKSGCFPDATTYNTLIETLCDGKKIKQAYEVMDAMVKQGISPNHMTYLVLMRAHQNKQGFWPAMQLMEKMSKQGCQPNLAVYKVIIRICDKGRLPDQVLKMWKEMVTNNVVPDLITYKMLLCCLHDANYLTEACKYHNEMVEKDLLKAKQYGITYRIWKKLLKAKRLDDAISMWECLRKNERHVNVFAFSSWIEVLCETGFVLKASGYCYDMVELVILPPPRIYQLLMYKLEEHYGRRAKVEIRIKLRTRMAEKRLPIKPLKAEAARARLLRMEKWYKGPL